MMGTTFPDSVRGTHLPANGGRSLFDAVKPLLQSADFAGGNLEGTLLDGPGKRRPMTNPNTYFVFRTPTAYVSNLVDAGYDFMGIANNHINDFGAPGRTSTVQTLRNAGIAVAGLKKVCETAIVERNGVKYGVAQVGHGGNNVSINDLDEVRRVVKELKQKADIVILSFHGGAEGSKHSHVPRAVEYFVGERRGDVVAVAHAAIDAGADVVFGHGPHVVRAAELYKDRIIFYSLGNFCTPYRINIKGINGYAPIAIVQLDRDGCFVKGKIHSFIQQSGAGPRLDPNNLAAKQIATLTAQDFPNTPLAISPDGTITLR
ncbi:MAG: CapA family protein [Muribaculaceae bacterium]|nr:CapA family protein [Muribaculaceae bacterium]